MPHFKVEVTAAEGYARPVSRGVTIANEEYPNGIYLDDLIYNALGDEYSMAGGADLKNIRILIEFDGERA